MYGGYMTIINDAWMVNLKTAMGCNMCEFTEKEREDVLKLFKKHLENQEKLYEYHQTVLENAALQCNEIKRNIRLIKKLIDQHEDQEDNECSE